MLKIKQVSNQSEIKTLRKYGHRVFMEVNEKLEPINYFIEMKSEEAPIPVKRTREVGKTLAKNVALIWTGKQHIHYTPGTAICQVALLCSQLAAKPARRNDLSSLVAHTSDPKVNEVTVSTSISTLYRDGYLKVAGEN